MVSLLLSQPAAKQTSRIVHRQLSPHATIYVVDEGAYRYLRFDDPQGDDQSMHHRAAPHTVPMEYIRNMIVGPLHLAAAPRRAVMIGLGAGSYASLLHRLYSALVIDNVEIEAAVLDVAQRFFALVLDERLRAHIADGRAWLEQAAPSSFELIVIDAYSGTGVPSHLASKEFFELTQTKLAAGGVVVVNIAAADDAEERDLLATMAASFSHLRCFMVQESANIIVVAAPRELPPSATLRLRARALDKAGRATFAVSPILQQEAPCPGGPARIVRDAPVTKTAD